jgi:hypothetical protein
MVTIMTSPWEQKAKDTHWAFMTSGSVVILLNAFTYAFFSQADPGFATSFSSAFSLDADLGKCSSSFSAIIMAQMVYSIIFTLLLAFVAGRCAIGAITDPESRKAFLWTAGGALLFGGFLIGLGTGDHGWWLSRLSRSLFSRGVPLSQACLDSRQVLYPQLYVISIWLAGMTWIILLTLLNLTRVVTLHRKYDQLPKDPQLQEEILKARATYPPIPMPKPKRAAYSILGLILIVGGCIAGLAHGVYKAAIAFALLALGR